MNLVNVIHKRFNGRVDFRRNWFNFTNGFGDLTSEFWLGNKYIHELTNGYQNRVLFLLKKFDSKVVHTAVYNQFNVGNEAGWFKLSITDFVSSLSDVTNSMAHHNGKVFTTIDEDHDESAVTNCAQLYAVMVVSKVQRR